MRLATVLEEGRRIDPKNADNAARVTRTEDGFTMVVWQGYRGDTRTTTLAINGLDTSRPSIEVEQTEATDGGSVMPLKHFEGGYSSQVPAAENTMTEGEILKLMRFGAHMLLEDPARLK